MPTSEPRPTHRPSPTRRLLYVLLAVFGLAIVLAVLPRLLADTPPPTGNLTGASIESRFALLDENGTPVTSASYDGKWRLMYFGYTFCPDICPADLATMAAGVRAFEERHPRRVKHLQPLFLTVDPARDTPKVMAEYTSHFLPDLVGLTGTPEAVDAALRNFRIYATKVPGATPGSYTMDHLAVFYLFAPDGTPVQFLAGAGAAPEDVTAMLEAFVR